MTRGERVCAFIERYCLVPEGALVGKPLRLLPFQRSFVLEIYDNPAGTRRAILSIARKNGKTALIAALLLAHLVGPEARLNSQIVSGARSREQAAVVFALAEKMVRLSPELSKLVRIVPSGKRLIGLAMNVEYRALAAEGSTAHGLSPVLAILDELGQVKGPKDDFVDAIVTGQGAHDNPLCVVISTQAPTDADMLSLWIDDAVRANDPHTVCRVYSAPEDAAIDDEGAWAAANPALGVFRSKADLAEQAARAMRLPSDEATFRNLGLNQRVTRHNPFVSRGVWTANGGEPDAEAFAQGEVFVGLDLSETTDLTALVAVARYQGLYHVRPHFWLPGQLVAERARADRVPYVEWLEAGHLKATPGASIDYAWLGAEIAALLDGMNVQAFAFDRYRMKLVRPHIEAAGASFPFLDWGQGWVSMSPAVQALEVELLHERLRHGGHPVLTMCASNAVVWKDAAGNRKLDKAKSSGRIDGMVALAMAIGAASMNEPTANAPSPWDDPSFSLVAA